MKIKLTVNAPSKVPNQYENIDTSYGFTHWSPRYPELIGIPDNSFSIKLIKTLNKVLNIKDNLNEKQENIIQHTGEALNYVTSLLPQETLDNLHVQINVNSKANKLSQKITQYVNDNIVTLSDNFGDKLDAKESRVYIRKNKTLIVLGEESLSNYPKIIQEHGIGVTAQLILCHEIGHSLERTNEKKYGRKEDPLTSLIYKSSTVIFRQNGNKNGINEYIDANDLGNKYAKIDELLWTNINIVHGEMYADLAGVIMLRNLALKQGNYNEEKFTNLVDTLSNERLGGYKHHKYESEHLKGLIGFENLSREIECDRFDSFLPENMFHMIRNSRHLTSPALNSFSKNIESLGNKILTEEEIDQMCCKHVKIGMAVIFNACLTINPELEKQLYTMDAIVFEGDNREGKLDITKTKESHNKTLEYISSETNDELKNELTIFQKLAAEKIKTSKYEDSLYTISMSKPPMVAGLKAKEEIDKNEAIIPLSPKETPIIFNKEESISRIAKMRKAFNEVLFPKTEIPIESILSMKLKNKRN